MMDVIGTDVCTWHLLCVFRKCASFWL